MTIPWQQEAEVAVLVCCAFAEPVMERSDTDKEAWVVVERPGEASAEPASTQSRAIKIAAIVGVQVVAGIFCTQFSHYYDKGVVCTLCGRAALGGFIGEGRHQCHVLWRRPQACCSAPGQDGPIISCLLLWLAPQKTTLRYGLPVQCASHMLLRFLCSDCVFHIMLTSLVCRRPVLIYRFLQ